MKHGLILGGEVVHFPRYHLKSQAWWLLLISGIFSLSVGLSNTFVNIYLWKVDHDYSVIGWYNFCVYATMPLAFLAAGYVAKRVHTVWALRIGIGMHAVFYGTTLFGGTRVAGLPALLGVLMGTAAGFYWFAFNTLCVQSTEPGERDHFFSLNGIMAALAGMLAPPTAGFFIAYEDRIAGLTGYHFIFAMSLALFVVATIVSLKLQARHLHARLQMKKALLALQQRPWRMIVMGCAVYGLREGLFLFLIGLLFFIASGSELRLGEFLLLQSALSFVSFFVVGRLLKPNNRIRVLGMGAGLMALAALFFTMPVTSQLIVAYGCLIAVAIPLFLTPLQGFIFDGMASLENASQMYAEHVIVREIFENTGRVLGIAAFLYLAARGITVTKVAHLAIGLGFVQLGTWALIRAGRPVIFERTRHFTPKANRQQTVKSKKGSSIR